MINSFKSLIKGLTGFKTASKLETLVDKIINTASDEDLQQLKQQILNFSPRDKAQLIELIDQKVDELRDDSITLHTHSVNRLFEIKHAFPPQLFNTKQILNKAGKLAELNKSYDNPQLKKIIFRSTDKSRYQLQYILTIDDKDFLLGQPYIAQENKLEKKILGKGFSGFVYIKANSSNSTLVVKQERFNFEDSSWYKNPKDPASKDKLWLNAALRWSNQVYKKINESTFAKNLNFPVFVTRASSITNAVELKSLQNKIDGPTLQHLNLAKDLATYMAQQQLSKLEVAAMLDDLYSTIKFLDQECQVLHGDLNLSNIIYHQAKRCLVLIDFGLSTKISPSASGDKINSGGINDLNMQLKCCNFFRQFNLDFK